MYAQVWHTKGIINMPVLLVILSLFGIIGFSGHWQWFGSCDWV